MADVLKHAGHEQDGAVDAVDDPPPSGGAGLAHLLPQHPVPGALGRHDAGDPLLDGEVLQIRRALKPDGLFLAAMFGGETLKELRRSLA